ncbi:hypothetical protein [Neobacillus niacini]|uniref:hypothetical protein n=1 Tax=Neobacillus niacini TaxID=86668 RepID=UPI00187C0C56|nr:hypothetical protein [Neobacillus niacini]
MLAKVIEKRCSDAMLILQLTYGIYVVTLMVKIDSAKSHGKDFEIDDIDFLNLPYFI